MEGSLGKIIGIPIFENKNLREGTYICLDENDLPIKPKDIAKSIIAKIIVHDIKTFKMAINNNLTPTL